MSENNYVVPDGMINAAWEAVAAKMKECVEEGSGNRVAELHIARISLEAAVRWISENPPVPTSEQALAIEVSYPTRIHSPSRTKFAEEWIRRMFLATKEKPIPDGIVEYLNGTTRPVAIWWQGNRCPIQTLDSGYSVTDDGWFMAEQIQCPIDGALGAHKSAWGDIMPWHSEPEEVKDLLYASESRIGCDNPIEASRFIAESDRRVLEAYRRGRKGK